ncbi:MAG: DEAD/DEAH box helicase family protein [Sphaerochaetaceae bacterium]|nr:DEAD/DEAH box helicase family protein [Sphaerochaetaceae bacterium]
MEKLKFKKQDFQRDAVNSVCDIFEGQINGLNRYTFRNDKGVIGTVFAYKNNELSVSTDFLLKNIKRIQKQNDLKESDSLEGEGLNLTVEMETGTGKTYTYINTIYEMHKRYGWAKFVVVVPSIAIREGVYKSFQIMEDHFSTLYGKRIKYFIFDSQKVSELESFARNTGINVMIINNHAFNKAETNNMFKVTEYGRKLIDLIAGTNPVIIIDEPQSVEGMKTKIALKNFNPLFTLRYSATHRESYNMVYCLDAVDAFNKKLVKKISVKGIDIKGTTGTHSYMYLDSIEVSKDSYPKARIEIEVKQKSSVNEHQMFKLQEKDDLYIKSGKLQEYQGFKIAEINGIENIVRFTNGKKISVGDCFGKINDKHIRRIQIRESIKSHIQKERNLFEHGIKTISLFFIDEVANYRVYDDQGNQKDGLYAQMFLKEYNYVLEQEKDSFSKEYLAYLNGINSEETHKGYFSIDKKGKLVNPTEAGKGAEKTCNDVSAYDLIMKEKEKLLDLKEPTRFIFSHSALREGWDNPNVFQICVLRNNDSKTIRKRQEIGRGLRLCVNQEGIRIDSDFTGIDFEQANVLTVIANENYESFAKDLQKEYYEELANRPTKLTIDFLTKRKIDGLNISEDLAKKIIYDFTINKYVDENQILTEKFHQDIEKKSVIIREELKEALPKILDVVKELYSNKIEIENENQNKIITNKLNNNFKKKEFADFWDLISQKTSYSVDFDTKELTNNSVDSINSNLIVAKLSVEIKTGESKSKVTRDDIKTGDLFERKEIKIDTIESEISDSIKYDLIGQLVEETGLTRKTIITVLQKIRKEKFDLFKQNPEDFIIKISKILNIEKAKIILDKIEYYKTKEKLPIEIFENNIVLNGKVLDNLNKYIYDYLVWDSNVEKNMAKDIDDYVNVKVFSKIPRNQFNINTPVGNFSPDWMIVFDKDKVKYSYFVAETKGSTNEMELRLVEEAKIKCAKKHFEKISNDKVKFDAVNGFNELLLKIQGS